MQDFKISRYSSDKHDAQTCIRTMRFEIITITPRAFAAYSCCNAWLHCALITTENAACKAPIYVYYHSRRA